MNNHNEVCSICKSNNVITDPESAEMVCSNCGMVISDKIQENRESRTLFNTEQAIDRRRTGMPISLVSADMGLSTVIAFVIDFLKRRKPQEFYDHRIAVFVPLDKPEVQKVRTQPSNPNSDDDIRSLNSW